MHRKLTFLWFVLGLGSRLQVISSLSITELIVLAAAPILFLRNYSMMKHDGIVPLFFSSILVILGCVIASVMNHTPFQFVVRGLAVTCIVSCSIVFAHWLIRRDPNGFKWYILALPFSAILSTFVFKAAVETTMYGESAEEIMSGPLFWVSRLGPLVLAPTKGWYLQTPWFINATVPIFVAGLAVLTSVSGRAAALTALAFTAMVIIGGKTQRTISRISSHFGLLCFCGIILVLGIYSAYKVSASQGLLGEDARKKYETQTHGGEGGIGRLLLGGRGESFIGLLACRDKPIIGWGPWAKDENGYAEEFINKYGTWEDVEEMVRLNMWRAKFGAVVRMLPCHSYLTEFWAWYGLFGLVFWLYVMYVLLRYLKQDVAAVPQWYAWLACTIPGLFWDIFFSPLSDRVGVSLFVVACLMARAVRKGRFQLPPEMIHEIGRVERM